MKSTYINPSCHVEFVEMRVYMDVNSQGNYVAGEDSSSISNSSSTQDDVAVKTIYGSEWETF